MMAIKTSARKKQRVPVEIVNYGDLNRRLQSVLVALREERGIRRSDVARGMGEQVGAIQLLEEGTGINVILEDVWKYIVALNRLSRTGEPRITLEELFRLVETDEAADE